MRLLLSFALVLSMSPSEIERAQQMARSRASEREQFHRRYVFDLRDATVTQVEVITEFRRLVLITEEHIFRGDWMFSRGTRSAEQALAPSRGNGDDPGARALQPTQHLHRAAALSARAGRGCAWRGSGITRDAGDSRSIPTPFKARDGKTLSSLIGATLEAEIGAVQLGQASRIVAVMLEGKELARTAVEFGRLD